MTDLDIFVECLVGDATSEEGVSCFERVEGACQVLQVPFMEKGIYIPWSCCLEASIWVNPNKVVVVRVWKHPNTIIEIHNFLGLVVYYCTFIEKFNMFVVPLTKLTKNNVKFIWTEDCEITFSRLKYTLTTNHILLILVRGCKLVVYTDAYRTTLGAVLIQEGKVVPYSSRHLKPYKVIYPLYELELIVVDFTLKMWKHYLYGRKL